MIWFFIIFNLVVILGGLKAVKFYGRKNHIPFFFCLLTLSIYCLVTPTYFYLMERQTPIGNDGFFNRAGKTILPYYELGMLFYLLANSSFIFSYLLLAVKNAQYNVVNNKYFLVGSSNLQRKVVTVFAIIFSIVLIDLVLSGLSPLKFLLGDSDIILMGSMSVSGTYYFRNFADSLISILVIYAYIGGNKKVFLVLNILAFVMFTLMGFRYRVILTVLGYIFVYLYKYDLKKVNIIKFTSLALVLIYLVLFITYNRWSIAFGSFNELVYDPAQYETEVVFEQTRASLADINLLRYYDQNPAEPLDYGNSMFIYIFIKIIPKQFFESGEKPYPPPFNDLLERALELPSTFGKTGEASTHYAAFYNAFGWWGVIFMPALMSLAIFIFTKRNHSGKPLGFIKQVCFALCLFQFISRGYLPQFIDHFVYIFIPIWMLGKSINNSTELQAENFSNIQI